MIWKEPGAPVLEIEIADPFGIRKRRSGSKTDFSADGAAFSQESLAGSYQRMVAARMFRVATEIIPFLENHVIKGVSGFSFSQDCVTSRSNTTENSRKFIVSHSRN